MKSNDHLRRIPQVQVRDRINDLLPDVRQCTLKELEIFGRGFNPRTSSVVISAYHRGTTIYRTMLVNNLSEEMRARFLKELA
ncbi:hypothetical protein H6768_03900 [Candidatus Peribacteria bacterium]|nr:hypothetical protein [Candidatus Peribacteria bacterium]